MARPRQPTDLLLVKGKKHLTKEEIAKRKASEVKAPADKVRAPSYLPNDLKKEFRKIAKELLDIEILTNLDVDALARFIISRKMYLELTQKILENTALLLDKDTIGIQDKLFKQCRAAASDLGLTISSRCKLVVPKKEEKKEPGKFAKFGRGGSG
ncbi:phage terminase small subunit P27 family [Cytobacillus oceanisediminis]|uniref:phage terminase small subunit P27 family n=1 Tax=Cytobacillus oceanisediminis TaxID=665099 RepID=UPI00203B009B|nr:phage terminase small subunit P27 family [Cytobacillus oceanisediminis]MCM3242699.1 phage terminase small subunit P27 family [Cytobacillus oceanisediminis]